MKSTAIIFCHHVWNKRVINNLASFALNNPHCDVIPLSYVSTPSVRYFPRGAVDHWAMIDTLMYAWFLDNSPKYSRYILFEHDCFCNRQRVEDFYGDAFNADFACSLFKRSKDHVGDESFGDRGLKLSIGAKQYWSIYPQLCAAVPLVGSLLSHRAMEAVCTVVLDREWMQYAFSEVRLGTAINLCGITPVKIRPDSEKFLWWTRAVNRGKGIYHKPQSATEGCLWHLKHIARIIFTKQKFSKDDEYP